MMWGPYGYGTGWGWMIMGWIMMVVFWGLIIVGIVALIRWVNNRNVPGRASASMIGGLLAENRLILNMISGLVIVVMGLTLVGVLRLPALARDYRLLPGGPPKGAFGATLLGGAFAFAWIPCIGPILASILLYAGSAGTAAAGALLLLLIYALGLGVPFILTGLAFTRAVKALRCVRRFTRPIEVFSGVALTTVGVLMLANKMFYVSIWAQRVFTRLGLNLWQYF